eukprot:CAMPEP_0195008348 /NCGR_PEP_ID=MMETSP0326_2-20130528/8388_1 /TAXON_ID=2866 ORGANISM="Crypthecodinium cohnii, Strain Seligo" /NCGR_SAMPLE_ID=MMETSP0326_2 /ASSEMBLY_ACC=CAM_ASM_000348 /LENGTH=65 /DNA_ID=CAMNT_0040016115 /DNA_START=422 /DNA_END=615 /DNA_ORIENTATION=-
MDIAIALAAVVVVLALVHDRHVAQSPELGVVNHAQLREESFGPRSAAPSCKVAQGQLVRLPVHGS